MDLEAWKQPNLLLLTGRVNGGNMEPSPSLLKDARYHPDRSLPCNKVPYRHRWCNKWAAPEMLDTNLPLLQCVLLSLSGSLSLFPQFHSPPQISLLGLPGGCLLFPHLTENSLSLPCCLLWFQSLLPHNQMGKLKMLLSIPNHGWPTRDKRDPTASVWWSHAISNTLSSLWLCLTPSMPLCLKSFLNFSESGLLTPHIFQHGTSSCSYRKLITSPGTPGNHLVQPSAQSRVT